MRSIIVPAAFLLISHSAICAEPSAVTEPPDAAMASFEQNLRQGDFAECRQILDDKSLAFPESQRLVDARFRLANFQFNRKDYQGVLSSLADFLPNGKYADNVQSKQARINYARAATKVGKEDEAKIALVSLKDDPDPAKVLWAYNAFCNFHLDSTATIEELTAWKSSLLAAAEKDPEASLAQKLQIKLADLEQKIQGGGPAALRQAFFQKYREFETAVNQKNPDVARQALEAADAACEAWYESLPPIEQLGAEDPVNAQATCLLKWGIVKSCRSQYQEAKDIFAQVLVYKNDPRLAGSMVIAQAELCAIYCDRALGTAPDQIETRLIELLTTSDLNKSQTVVAFDLLSQLAFEQGDLVTAYAYLMEISKNIKGGGATSAAEFLQRLNRDQPQLALAYDMTEMHSPAWLALEQAGKITENETGRTFIGVSTAADGGSSSAE